MMPGQVRNADARLRLLASGESCRTLADERGDALAIVFGLEERKTLIEFVFGVAAGARRQTPDVRLVLARSARRARRDPRQAVMHLFLKTVRRHGAGDEPACRRFSSVQQPT